MRRQLVAHSDPSVVAAFDRNFPPARSVPAALPEHASEIPIGKRPDGTLVYPSQQPAPVDPADQENWWQKVNGAVEAAANVAVSIPTGIIAGLAGPLYQFGTGASPKAADAFSRKVSETLTLPTSPTGQRYTANVGKAMESSGLTAVAPLAETAALAQSIPSAARAVGDDIRARTGAPEAQTRIEPVLKPKYMVRDGKIVRMDQAQAGTQPAGQSISANAAPQVVPDLVNATPETQAVVAQAKANNLPINREVLTRHVEAETLPVPMKLSQGQASMDPRMISDEMNGRGSGKGLPPEFFNTQGKQLGQNAQAIRDAASPQVTATNPVESGQLLIDRYKAMDAPVVADISAKYKALQDANGGQFPLDGAAFVDAADAALRKNLKSHYVPPGVRSTLNDLREGGAMTFEDFEALRSDLAETMRSAADGKERAAAGIIRQQLENMPLTPEAAKLKPLADAARSAARDRFAKIEADPAYKAAIGDGVGAGEPSPAADKFVNAYVINGKVANVKQMKANLGADPVANQVIAGGTVNHLMAKAGVEAKDTGAFSQAGWNRALNDVAPKIDLLLDPQTASNVVKLGNVAKYTQAQPRGSFVNNSNTFTAMAAEAAKSSAEGAANVAAGGVPVGTWTRKIMERVRAGNAVKQSLSPAAGVVGKAGSQPRMTKLSDFPRNEPPP